MKFKNFQLEQKMKPTSALSKTHSNISKLLTSQKVSDMLRQERKVQVEARDKYNRFKKTASLPHYYLNQGRIGKITTIYRSLTQHPLRTYNHHKSSRPSSMTPQKKSPYITPFSISNNNQKLSLTNENAKNKQKLTLNRGSQNHPPSSTQERRNSSQTRVRRILSKLQDLLKVSKDALFSQQFQKCVKSINQVNQNEDSVYGMKVMEECCRRRESIEIHKVKEHNQYMDRMMSDLQTELKKKAIRANLDERNIEKAKIQLKEAQAKIAQLQAKKKQVREMATNTDLRLNSTGLQEQNPFLQQTQLFNLTNNTGSLPHYPQNIASHPQSQRLAACMKKMHQYKQRQTQLLGVLVVLQKEGIDVEKVYSDVLNGKTSVSEVENQLMEGMTEKAKQSERKMYHRCRKIKLDNSVDADASIISSADGLSFNYEDKSLEEDVFTARHEYKCKQDLGQEMRDRLKLNFNVLYEDIDPYEDYEDDQSG